MSPGTHAPSLGESEWYVAVKKQDVPMMILHTKPCSSRPALHGECHNNRPQAPRLPGSAMPASAGVIARSSIWCGPGPVRETTTAQVLRVIRQTERSDFTEMIE